ncbi:hypothetical protein ACFL35_02455 [Candidatus Riflebacteria bacterium]
MRRKYFSIFTVFIHLFVSCTYPIFVQAGALDPGDKQNSENPSEEYSVSRGKWINLPSGQKLWLIKVDNTPIAFTEEQYKKLIQDDGLTGDDKFYDIESVRFSDILKGKVDSKMLFSNQFWAKQARIKMNQNLRGKKLYKRTRAKTHKAQEQVVKDVTSKSSWAKTKDYFTKVKNGAVDTADGRSKWQLDKAPDSIEGASGHYSKQGLAHAKESLKISFSPKNILLIAGLTTAMELGRQVVSGEKPSVKKVVKLMASAQFVGGFAGSIAGATIGSFAAPALTAIPFVGGVLSAAAPVFGAVAGSMFGAGLGETKSVKKALLALDPYEVAGRGIGTVIGTVLGLPLGPLGVIVGSLIGSGLGASLGRKMKEWFDRTRIKRQLKKLESINMDDGSENTYAGEAGQIDNADTREVIQAGQAFISGENRQNKKLFLQLLEAQEEYKKYIKAGQNDEAEKALKRLNELKAQLGQ